MKIIKRDKTLEEFDFNKVKQAITNAFVEQGYGYLDDLDDLFFELEDSLPAITNDDTVELEELQDLIEEVLMDFGYKDVAKAYILYRYEHQIARETKMANKLAGNDIQNQNANVDEISFGGRIGESNRVFLKDYALYHCMSKKSRLNHLNNEIYIHDLDSYAVGESNCLSIPFDDLLKNGFKVKNSDIRPAGSINTAFQLVAVIFQLQSLNQFGGVSATHLDWTMVPYVRKSFNKHLKKQVKWLNIKDHPELNAEKYEFTLDYNPPEYLKQAWQNALDSTIEELNQAVEGMYHNLNTLLSRSGDQLPFSSINYGTCTLVEGRMVTKALLEGSINGVGKYHKTSIFPCGIFQYMKGVNDKPGTPNYDLYKLALESTSKRLYPNYVNVDWSVNAGYDKNDPRTYVSTMGCRTYNGFDINGFGQLKDGRGNICPVTIILPTLAMKSKIYVEKNISKDLDFYKSECIKSFLKLLNIKINEAKDMLLERFDHICSQPSQSAKFMWENNTMAGYVPEEGIRSALKHGTLAIGQLGLAETLQILIGKDHTTKEGLGLAKQIESLFSNKCKEFKEKYKLNFGVYYTPAENLCHTALKKFREKYGILENISDKEFFTNSMHVPVWHKCTPFEKIDIESQLTGYSSAGCITYVELPSTVNNNIEALETLVNYAMDRDIPYFAVNVPVDDCDDCGASGEFGEECPVCHGKNIKRLRRVTGYLTGSYKDSFNIGKQDEVNHRVKHAQ